jgi:hypothetical protein
MYSSAGHSCLGFCLDLTSRSVLRGTYPAAQRPIHVGNDLVSLEDVLFSADNKWQPLTQEDRYILCITLVASFLQLYKTPWVGDRWSGRDIHFFEQPLAATDHGITARQAKRADIHHAFVSKTYTSAAQPLPTTATTQQAPQDTIYTTPSTTHDDSINLLTLARLLLEIQSGRRIESLRQTTDLGPGARPNEATDLQTLKRWVRLEKGNLSFAFREAVLYCMKGFADPDTDLGDLGCRAGVVEGVVVPLEEELVCLMGGW